MMEYPKAKEKKRGRPPKKKEPDPVVLAPTGETRERFYYRLLVRLMLKLELLAQGERGFELKDVCSRELLQFWREEKQSASHEELEKMRAREKRRKVASFIEQRTPEELKMMGFKVEKDPKKPQKSILDQALERVQGVNIE